MLLNQNDLFKLSGDSMDVIREKAALIVVDVQKAVDNSAYGGLNNPDAEQAIVDLVYRWRRYGLPLYFVQYHSPREQSPFHKDKKGSELKESLKPLPGETLIVKNFESAFVRTDLERLLKKTRTRTLLIAGFYTDQCIAATAKVANNLGFDVHVLADATATVGCRGYNNKFYEPEDVFHLALGNLIRDGITIIESTDV
jgi:nicotinamidase-related amidase